MRVQNGSRWLKLAVSVGLALALFAFFLKGVDFKHVLEVLGKVKLGWVALSVVLSLASYAFRGLRWGVILEPLGPRPPVIDLLGCTAAGFATSAVLPARAGELVRPLLLSARTRLPGAGTVASVLTERLADLATILVLFAAGVLASRSEMTPGSVKPLQDAAALAALGLVVAVLAVIVLLRRRERAVELCVRLVPHRLRDRVRAFLHHLLDGVEIVRKPVALLRLAGWSLTVWIPAGLQVVALAKAFDIRLDFMPSFVFMAVSVIGLAVPTPAGVGGFDKSIQVALTWVFGVELERATAFAVLHHLVCFLPITVLGLTYIGSVGLSLRRVRELEAPTPDAGGGH